MGSSPAALAVDPETRTLFVANADSDTVSVIGEGASSASSVSTVSLPKNSMPGSVAVDPISHHVYVGDLQSDSVSELTPEPASAAGYTVSTISLGSPVGAVAVDTSSHTVYAVEAGRLKLAGIDQSTHAVHAIDIPLDNSDAGGSTQMLVDPIDHAVFVTNGTALTAYNTATDQVIATVPMGLVAAHLAINTNEHHIYALASNGDTIDVSFRATNGYIAQLLPPAMITTAQRTPGAGGAVFDPATSTLDVTHPDQGTLVMQLVPKISVLDQWGGGQAGGQQLTITGTHLTRVCC